MNSIKLDLDMGAMAWISGNVKSISSGQDTDYISQIELIIPFQPGQIPDGSYQVEYKGDQVEIVISTLNTPEQDPLMYVGRRMRFGAPEATGLPTLPFQVVTDNRGVYPAVLATIVFPRRVAEWVDDNHEMGIKIDLDYEAMQVTGTPNNAEKILALVVLNRLINTLATTEKRIIKYDEVTVFSEVYLDKKNRSPLLGKINALTSEHAYKDAIYDYLLPHFRKAELSPTINALHLQQGTTQIANEGELKKTVETVIEKVFKHHIESRRWIEPFWDGERKIELDGKKILIPREPKGEIKIQPTLHVIFDMALSPLGIQVIRESDEGIGSLDFRFLYTTKSGIPLSVGVEFKLAHHKQIKKGISSQLPAYLRAIRSNSGIFVVMWFKDSEYFKEPSSHEKNEMEIWLAAEALDVSNKNGFSISSSLIDASIRTSASIT